VKINWYAVDDHLGSITVVAAAVMVLSGAVVLLTAVFIVAFVVLMVSLIVTAIGAMNLIGNWIQEH
jgi:hypothetical protein